MGNFAENLNLGNRFRPPLFQRKMDYPKEPGFVHDVRKIQVKLLHIELIDIIEISI